MAVNIVSSLPRCIWLLARGAALFDQQYARTWRLLESTDLAVLLADETYWEVLQRNLSAPLRQRVGAELKRRMLERQLEAAAAFRTAFEDLQRGPVHLRRVSLARGVRALAQLQAARLTWVILALPIVIMQIPIWYGGLNTGSPAMSATLTLLPVGVSVMILISISAHNGPPLVQFRATLAALCDYLLRDDSQAAAQPKLPRPLHTPRWWQRLCDWWLGVEEKVRCLIQGPLN